ncbi:ABC transporter ATP-binding protein [Streptococcus ruminantium]|nr:ABC transporter ATP-binding protein [Streptococcus ruminantium]MDQ8767626.1 ABC transporter ATP-binding protein [Streptococcus ruminantium]MDQ8780659.1 ABC transporter ATP-binding protein [Streptococcus ruminantium]
MLIQLNNINKSYNVGLKQFQILKGIELSIEEGDFIGILGQSGSGKSTLLNILGFLDNQFEGDYYFRGQNILDLNDNRLSEYRNKEVGFIFQNFSLIDTMTVFENISLPLLYRDTPIEVAFKKVEKCLRDLGIKEYRDQYPNLLSGGQQQRVAIARAIVTDPSFLIADEPTGALDSKTSIEIMEVFSNLNKRGVTIVLVTHDVDITKYCNRIINLKDGEIIE